MKTNYSFAVSILSCIFLSVPLYSCSDDSDSATTQTTSSQQEFITAYDNAGKTISDNIGDINLSKVESTVVAFCSIIVSHPEMAEQIILNKKGALEATKTLIPDDTTYSSQTNIAGMNEYVRGYFPNAKYFVTNKFFANNQKYTLSGNWNSEISEFENGLQLEYIVSDYKDLVLTCVPSFENESYGVSGGMLRNHFVSRQLTYAAHKIGVSDSIVLLGILPNDLKVTLTENGEKKLDADFHMTLDHSDVCPAVVTKVTMSGEINVGGIKINVSSIVLDFENKSFVINQIMNGKNGDVMLNGTIKGTFNQPQYTDADTTLVSKLQKVMQGIMIDDVDITLSDQLRLKGEISNFGSYFASEFSALTSADDAEKVDACVTNMNNLSSFVVYYGEGLQKKAELRYVSRNEPLLAKNLLAREYTLQNGDVVTSELIIQKSKHDYLGNIMNTYGVVAADFVNLSSVLINYCTNKWMK